MKRLWNNLSVGANLVFALNLGRSRFGRSQGSPLRYIIIITLCLVCTACPKRPAEKPPEVEHRRPPVIRPESTEVSTPEQRAAEQLIQSGIDALENDDPEKAEETFQEALRIAPSYGPAYYWLARAKYDLDQLPQAWDLLDRAELLVGHASNWLERIDQLRAAISNAGE